MLRSLYSGISGMKANQTKLDVIGNNVANVGTTAFKTARVRFQDMLSQNVTQALAPGSNQGGVNPRQVGLGVQLAGIDTVVTQGMMQPTSRNLDVATDGEGYFLVGSGRLPLDNKNAITLNGSGIIDTNGMGISYTRDGSFTLDEQGNLLTSDGYRVLGYAATVNGGESSVKYTNQALESVNFVNANDLSLKAEDTIIPLVIPDAVKVHATSFSTAADMKQSAGKTATGPKIVNNTAGTPYDGKNLTVQIKYSKDTNQWSYTTDGTNWTTPAPATIDIAGANGIGQPGAMKITLPTTAPANDAMWTQSLYKEGSDVKIKTFNIGKNGLITAVLDDGSVSALGQIAMASFKNPAGLTKLGRNLYERSANSGEAIIRSGIGAANDNSKGYGDVLQGMLEMSNVDLAEQFTDMIVTSRAFQANSKTITTGDEILQDILNLKR